MHICLTKSSFPVIIEKTVSFGLSFSDSSSATVDNYVVSVGLVTSSC